MTLNERLFNITYLSAATDLTADNFRIKFGYSHDFQNGIERSKTQRLRDANDFWKYIVDSYTTDQINLRALYPISTDISVDVYNEIINIIKELLNSHNDNRR